MPNQSYQSSNIIILKCCSYRKPQPIRCGDGSADAADAQNTRASFAEVERNAGGFIHKSHRRVRIVQLFRVAEMPLVAERNKPLRRDGIL